MGRAYIGLGSNLGDGRQNLLAAWHRLGEQPGVFLLALSHPYLTRPLLKPEWMADGLAPGDNLFTNGVGFVECALSARALLTVMLRIETELGRDRRRTVDRPIDLDLLYYDDLILAESDLRLPHPEIPNRRFVLAPLTELAPAHRHPLLGLTSREMLENLPEDDADELQRLNWRKQQGPLARVSGVH
jgi:2-amino-4-hydroxy-6-hydroxymethyldihydropteridine diphosphokinase